jgi:AcrR family transcriptional regulator
VTDVPTPLVPTAQRILEAATSEFAERGLAGARVDRIAERAGANKQRIYAYFGSKEELFDRVVEARIGDLLDAVPFDATDLPGYATRLYAFNRAHPELVRLMEWHNLERPGQMSLLPQAADSTAGKVAALRAEQQRHPDRFADLPAERLLAQVLALVHGATLTAVAGPDVPTIDLADAVARIAAPA